jgi:integrase/recombinase XerD
MRSQARKPTTSPSPLLKKRSGEPSQSDHHGEEKRTRSQAHARSQRAKRDTSRRSGEQPAEQQEQPARSLKKEQQEGKANHGTKMTFSHALASYLDDHRGGNHSHKTLEWHETALGLLQRYLEQERNITLVPDIDASDISSWFTHLRQTPGARGKRRSERTVQTYARSARAFFHWLVRQSLITENPFERVVFPKVGKPLIQTITDEEFEKLLLACTLPNADGRLAERATTRNRAILWVLYDTGIRVSELTNLRIADLDRKHGLITVKGKGSKERRIALGQNCLRHVLHYLDRHRPDEQELAEWGSPGEDHLFLSETRQPLTKNGMTLLFARLKKRAGLTGKRISPHIFRHTFAIRYLVLASDPFSLQEILGHEDMTTVKNYMHMNDETIQAQKRKYSPGDHLPASIPDPRQTRRRGYQEKDQKKEKHLSC